VKRGYRLAAFEKVAVAGAEREEADIDTQQAREEALKKENVELREHVDGLRATVRVLRVELKHR